MVTNDLVRWLVFIANIIGFVLALVWLTAAAKPVGKTDGVLIFFIVLFIVDALCVVPFVMPARA